MKIRTSIRRAVMALVTLLVAAVALGVGASPAMAHRDGCHRWHSCPSDSGSYVCGDLGYFSECGYSSLPGSDSGSDSSSDSGSGSGAGSGVDEDVEPEPVVDIEPPARPATHGADAAAGGRVSVLVSAEKGARIEVRDEADSVVAHATATGADQKIAFDAGDGEHAYTVVAVDASGNTSGASDEFTVTVDGTAPRAGTPALGVADPETGAAPVTLDAEAGASYEVTVEGRKDVLRGTVDDGGTVTGSLRLPNGTFRLVAVVRDEAGNRTRKEATVNVALKEIRPGVRWGTPEDGRTTVDVAGPPGSTGTVTTDGGAEPVRLDGDGRGSVTLPLKDGSYRALVTLTDTFGRRGTARSAEFVVDTVAPALRVVYDEERARHGDVVLTVTGERGATLRLDGADGSGPVVLDRERRVVSWHEEPGAHRLVARLTDAHGNTSVKELTLRVSDDMTGSEIRNALLGLAGTVVVLAVLALLVWRRRRAIIVWWARRRETARLASEERAALAVAARQEAEERRREEERRRAREAHERRLAVWLSTRDRLAAEYDFVRGLRGTEYSASDFRWAARKAGERVLLVAPAALVEVRTRQGVNRLETTVTGELVVTDRRLLFSGPGGRREWAYGKWLQHEHDESAGVTLISVGNRRKTSGVSYGHGEAFRVRMAIDLAVDRAQGRGDEVADRARAVLEAHERNKPEEPAEAH
ncbi:LPXTG cell wall anchor domain-containing protein [Streptomyces sp. NPDC005892]|uniref:LPXTG cell wall anchor domain-containing protein n=1 Tax=Streptomyces sp. NPDC005892 TaxID=3155593 RepID=UPI0033D3995C